MKQTFDNFVGTFTEIYTPEYCNQNIEYIDKFEESGLGHTRMATDGYDKRFKEDYQVFPAEQIVNFPVDLNYLLGKCMLENLVTSIHRYIQEYPSLKEIETWSIFSTKLQKTRVGEGYHMWHCENLTRQLCPRFLTFILYLNDVNEGGETEFLYFPKRIKPEQGKLVIWPAGFTHTHRGNPPLSNTKYIVTGWVEL